MIDDLIKQIGEWSHANFPPDKQKPEWGMAEESGEIIHCLLKRYQGIRGFDNDEFFINKLADAIADAGIYAANYAYNQKLKLIDMRLVPLAALTMDDIVSGLMLYSACSIGNSQVTQRPLNTMLFFSYLDELGKRFKLLPIFALMQKVFEHSVAKRDWKALPESADSNFPDLNFYEGAIHGN